MAATSSCSLASVASTGSVGSVGSVGSAVRAGALAVLAAAALLSGSADAHGYVTAPAAEFTGGMKTEYSATMSPVFGGKFNGSPQENVDTFTKQFEAHKNKYPDLKTLLSGQGKDCGNTNEFATPKAIPSDGVVVFQNPDSGDGFVSSHMGPCEIWLDDTRVFHDSNCAGNHPGKPKAELKVDFSACKGDKCLLRFYWLALHEPTWQVYKNCVPLIGNGGGKGNSNNNFVAGEYNSLSETPAPSPTPVPSPTPTPTEYSEYSDHSEYNTPAPTETSTTTNAPATTHFPSSTEYNEYSDHSDHSEYNTPAPTETSTTTNAPATTPSPSSAEYSDHSEYNTPGETPAATSTPTPTQGEYSTPAPRRNCNTKRTRSLLRG